MIKKNTDVMVALTDEQAAALLGEFPVEPSFVRINLPRLGMYSQDKFEGKGKTTVVVAEAGVFYIERATNDLDANGKKIYVKEELGTTLNAVIVFQRKQLRYYNDSTQEYTSSPIYDSGDEQVSLFLNRIRVATDTPENLKKLYPGVSKKTGKAISNLNEDRILYVLYNDELLQLNLHDTSMYSFLDYARKNPVPILITMFNSEAKKSGQTNWNQMTFVPLRRITPDEAQVVLTTQSQIKEGIAAEKAYFNRDAVETASRSTDADKVYDALGTAK